jgi:hypothetical protein
MEKHNAKTCCQTCRGWVAVRESSKRKQEGVLINNKFIELPCRRLLSTTLGNPFHVIPLANSVYEAEAAKEGSVHVIDRQC